MRSYKKLIPTLREFPGAAVITADDDIYYGPHWAGKLYRAYMENPRAVHCHRVTKFYKDEGQWRTSPGGYDVYPFPTYLHKLTGGSGADVLRRATSPEMVDESLFMRIAPTNDDVWFWLDRRPVRACLATWCGAASPRSSMWRARGAGTYQG